MLKNTYF